MTRSYTDVTHTYRRDRISTYKTANLFGANLQKAMDRLNITVPDLAFITGICDQTIRQWLSGHCAPNYYDILYLCDVVKGFSYDDFYPQS